MGNCPSGATDVRMQVPIRAIPAVEAKDAKRTKELFKRSSSGLNNELEVAKSNGDSKSVAVIEKKIVDLNRQNDKLFSKTGKVRTVGRAEKRPYNRVSAAISRIKTSFQVDSPDFYDHLDSFIKRKRTWRYSPPDGFCWEISRI
jgi:hypothetical protein